MVARRRGLGRVPSSEAAKAADASLTFADAALTFAAELLEAEPVQSSPLPPLPLSQPRQRLRWVGLGLIMEIYEH